MDVCMQQHMEKISINNALFFLVFIGISIWFLLGFGRNLHGKDTLFFEKQTSRTDVTFAGLVALPKNASTLKVCYHNEVASAFILAVIDFCTMQLAD